MLRWPKVYGWTTPQIQEVFRVLDHVQVNDTFIDLKEYELHLLSNPDHRPPSPAMTLPCTTRCKTPVIPPSPKSQSVGPIVSSEVTSEATYRRRENELEGIIELLKA
ncbi:uncharacterized protein LOC110033422 [Phalaenopsis equestris]|uniref:uncharacterized protein LOC110033422 n=1 Tax=Phalaenopsis equestris TaxID=78828 RepID=UPI0009E33108|nr:uncharacterized protein LOC110033422 [Phalaenopsis equestris]